MGAGITGPALADPVRRWVGLPWPRAPRWYLPQRSGISAERSLFVYHPVTWRSRGGWEVARILARRGAFRLPRGTTMLPREVWEAAAPFLPRGGSVAVARANHAGRFLALIVDREGVAVAFLKIARDTAGAQALDHERTALEHWARLLPPPLHAPSLRQHSEGVLVLEPVLWRPRIAPWTMPVEVAQALGAFFGTTASPDERASGVAHGDCAPWNLLHDDLGWALIDWENATEGMAPFYDLFHFLVQSSVELRRPTRRAILEGVQLKGPVGDTVFAYAEAAGIDPREAGSYFKEYLRRSVENIEPGVPGRAIRIRHDLRRSLRLDKARDSVG